MEKLALSIDIGATHLRTALINKKGEILKKISRPTNKKGKDGKIVSGQILEMIYQLTSGKFSQFQGIGIGTIGPLDYKKGGIEQSPNIPFKFVPLIEPISSASDLPVSLLNDCLCAVWAEKIYGAGKNLDNLVYITISTGIGVGAIVDGKLLLGKGGNAAEMGHQIIEEKYNFLCSCGKGRGHWEGIASGRNLPRFFRVWLKEKELRTSFKPRTAEDIFSAAENKDKIALNFLEELAKINARALSNIIVAYDPALITFGGAVALNNRGLILKPLKKYIDKFLIPPKIKITPLGKDIVLLGAAATIFYPFNMPSRPCSVCSKPGSEHK
jgi:glucokinase